MRKITTIVNNGNPSTVYQTSWGHSGRNPSNDDPVEWWNDVAVPLYLRQPYLDNSDENFANRYHRFAHNLSNTFGEAFAAIPFIGPLIKAGFQLNNNAFNQAETERFNRLAQAQANYENWFNSPRNQVRKLRVAGINPYQNGAVKIFPSAHPDMRYYQAPPPTYNSSFAQDLAAIGNYESLPYKITNLESLTDINAFKLDFLLPQLVEKNGYINNILSLQSAWEDGNYKKEREIKQQLLQTQYMNSLAEVGQNIIMLSPVDGRTLIDPVRGTMTFEFNDSPNGIPRVLTLNQLTFAEAPIFAQQAFLKTLAIQNGAELSQAQRSYYIDAANNQSMMAALNKFNADKLELYLDTYHRTGVWPNEDPVLRSAAGLMDWGDVWQQAGFNFLTRSADKGVDYVGKYATKSKGYAPLKGYSGTRTYTTPSGVKTMDFETKYLY